jgi:hypothetical protein
MESHITSTLQIRSIPLQKSHPILDNSQKESLQLTQAHMSPSTESSKSGASPSPRGPESPQKRRRTLEEIENDPIQTEPRILNMKASDLEKWRQVISHAKRRLYSAATAL